MQTRSIAPSALGLVLAGGAALPTLSPLMRAAGGPPGAAGQRVFSVTAEGETVLEDLDIFAEAGPATALVTSVEVVVEDGELNLQFSASEGAPTVAAIEVLGPAG